MESLGSTPPSTKEGRAFGVGLVWFLLSQPLRGVGVFTEGGYRDLGVFAAAVVPLGGQVQD